MHKRRVKRIGRPTAIALTCLAGMALLGTAQARSSLPSSSSSPSSLSKEQWNAAERSAVEVVTRWVDAWASKDAERVGAIMDEHCEYRLDPSQPVKRGRAAFVADVKMFIGGMNSMKITEAHAVGSELNVAVLIERVDDFTLKGKRMEIPVAIVFHVRGGKIVQLLDIPLLDLGADASGPPPGAAPL